jgi:hypothetical protein
MFPPMIKFVDSYPSYGIWAKFFLELEVPYSSALFMARRL